MYRNLKLIRLDRRETQQQIADKLGITRAYYTLIEGGNREITSDIALQLADYWNTSTDVILGRKPYKSKTAA